MLKSKDALVPLRNFSFGNKWSFTAMEKATALPLHAWFIPNSPMPMLDISDLLLLTTASTSCGGQVATEFCLGVSLLFSGCVFATLPWILLRFIVMRLWLFMVLVFVLCVFCCRDLQVVIFESSFSGMSCVETYVTQIWRAPAHKNLFFGWPTTYVHPNFGWGRTQEKIRSLSARTPISPFLLFLSPKVAQQHLSLSR